MKYRFLLLGSLLSGGILLDLITKEISTSFLGNGRREIIPHLLSLENIKNSGVAFGHEIPFQKTITVFFIGLLLGWWLYDERKKNHLGIDIAFMFLLAGALGNAWERFVYEQVRDFISVGSWFICNLADIWLTIGVLILGSLEIKKYLFRNKTLVQQERSS